MRRNPSSFRFAATFSPWEKEECPMLPHFSLSRDTVPPSCTR